MTLAASPRRSRGARKTEARTDTGRAPSSVLAAGDAPVYSGGPLFIDLDTVLLAQHQGRYGIELGLQADLETSLDRLRQIGGRLVVLVDPPPAEGRTALATARRMATLKDGLGEALADVLVVACPHEANGECTCAKPSATLIELAMHLHQLEPRDGWYIGGDQAGMQAGRTAGLKTIRIGPVGEDHLSSVHRPDYEARDLLDAANHIMFDALPLR